MQEGKEFAEHNCNGENLPEDTGSLWTGGLFIKEKAVFPLLF